MDEHRLIIQRTVRYHTLGDARAARAIWFVLHGYGQLARYFLQKFEGLPSEVFIVAPEGPSRFYLDEAHSRVGATWMTREDREAEIADHVAYLDQLAELIRRQCPAGIPLNVLGFSQGVATATRWAMLGRNPPAKLVLWGGSFPPEYEAAPLRDRLNRTAIHLVQGEADAIVTPSVMNQSTVRLRMAGLPITEHRHRGGHVLDPLLLQRILSAS
ncbi:MAG TPA: hypothetical protein VGE21_14355 [Flavobacteriales bacterium]